MILKGAKGFICTRNNSLPYLNREQTGGIQSTQVSNKCYRRNSLGTISDTIYNCKDLNNLVKEAH